MKELSRPGRCAKKPDVCKSSEYIGVGACHPLTSERPMAVTHDAAASALSALHYRVEFAELDAGVLGRELPIGLGGGSVAPMLPGVDVALQRRPVAHPIREVAAAGAQLQL